MDGTSTRTDSPLAGADDNYRVLPANIGKEHLAKAMRKNCLLFYCPDQEPLAKKIAAESEGNVEL
eukprot:scaffold321136_cov43-Prasinocladus_malaysianus.AAC.1